MFEDDDEDLWESEKFDECYKCKNRFNFNICEYDCDVGESFEEEDDDGLDKEIII